MVLRALNILTHWILTKLRSTFSYYSFYIWSSWGQRVRWPAQGTHLLNREARIHIPGGLLGSGLGAGTTTMVLNAQCIEFLTAHPLIWVERYSGHGQYPSLAAQTEKPSCPKPQTPQAGSLNQVAINRELDWPVTSTIPKRLCCFCTFFSCFLDYSKS